jgi:hypothetical protein
VEPGRTATRRSAEDVAAALAASPQAAFCSSIRLAQFYRRGYLRWVDATKRNPDGRAQRIAKMIDLLNAGVGDYRSQNDVSR